MPDFQRTPMATFRPGELRMDLSCDWERRVRGVKLASLKARRRTSLGPHLSLLFENRETVIGQVEDMVRLEGGSVQMKLGREMANYRCLIPTARCLRASLMVHSGSSEFGEFVASALERGLPVVTLEIDGHQAPARSLDARTSALSPLHYVAFHLCEGAEVALLGGHKASLHLRAPGIRMPQILSDTLCEELRNTLIETRLEAANSSRVPLLKLGVQAPPHNDHDYARRKKSP